jgi:hypothetical protein
MPVFVIVFVGGVWIGGLGGDLGGGGGGGGGGGRVFAQSLVAKPIHKMGRWNFDAVYKRPGPPSFIGIFQVWSGLLLHKVLWR